ncbi:hypothetical protein L3X38_037226 [Prunus dulcis]|uniref:Uncharacterized protein n=1 Tax=Prunus dulcis TaxID=3755 RepID=A0AAD4V2Z3_PRUDU|nr:hypothetical protein L3X38_037226 [Prunus dulcis]
MSGPTGGRNSKAPTPEHPTPCVASKLCPTRADWVITHRNIQRHGDDPKLYTKSFHTPEHPTPHMESVSLAGTSNAAKLVKRRRNHTSITEFGRRRRRRDGEQAPVRTSRARGRSSWFRRGKRAGLGRGVEASRTGPVSGPAVARAVRTEEIES